MVIFRGRLWLCILGRRQRAGCGAHVEVFGDQQDWRVEEEYIVVLERRAK